MYIPELNAFHTAGESRRQVQNCAQISKNCKIIEFHYYIWSRHGKCIQISTNMPSFGLVSHEIGSRI